MSQHFPMRAYKGSEFSAMKFPTGSTIDPDYA